MPVYHPVNTSTAGGLSVFPATIWFTTDLHYHQKSTSLKGLFPRSMRRAKLCRAARGGDSSHGIAGRSLQATSFAPFSCAFTFTCQATGSSLPTTYDAEKAARLQELFGPIAENRAQVQHAENAFDSPMFEHLNPDPAQYDEDDGEVEADMEDELDGYGASDEDDDTPLPDISAATQEQLARLRELMAKLDARLEAYKRLHLSSDSPSLSSSDESDASIFPSDATTSAPPSPTPSPPAPAGSDQYWECDGAMEALNGDEDEVVYQSKYHGSFSPFSPVFQHSPDVQDLESSFSVISLDD